MKIRAKQLPYVVSVVTHSETWFTNIQRQTPSSESLVIPKPQGPRLVVPACSVPLSRLFLLCFSFRNTHLSSITWPVVLTQGLPTKDKQGLSAPHSPFCSKKQLWEGNCKKTSRSWQQQGSRGGNRSLGRAPGLQWKQNRTPLCHPLDLSSATSVSSGEKSGGGKYTARS